MTKNESLTPGAFRLLCVLIDCANKRQILSYREAAKLMGGSGTTSYVQRLLQELQDAGLISHDHQARRAITITCKLYYA